MKEPAQSRPNIFSYATSELSQDAVISWILEWADPAYRETDSALHGVARDFVAALFRRAGVDPPSHDSEVRVAQQVKGADIVVEVGHDHLLIVEDKIHSTEHSDQLTRYQESLRNDHPDRTLVCVYLKTGDQSTYDGVERSGWSVFTRVDLLEVFRGGRGTVRHDVFIDFLEHVESIESAANRYQTVPPTEWAPRDDAYTGLYRALQSCLPDANWEFVNNPRGGFRGFWWGWRPIDGGQIYLQLEEQRLVVKVEVEDRDRRREVRDHWVDRVVMGMRGFRRPTTLGHGAYMTVGTSEQDYRRVGADGLLDLSQTAVFLTEVGGRLQSLFAT